MNRLFEIGDKVICVNSSMLREYTNGGKIPNLIEGKTYTVLGFCDCPKCGFIGVDVGLTAQNCDQRCVCGYSFKAGTIHYCSQTRFVKPETDHQLEEQIHESLKGIRIEN